MLVGLLASGLSTGLRLLAVGAGALALFFGVAMLAPKLVAPLVRCARLAREPDRWIRRPARPGQLGAQPGTDRFDRLGADDRADAGHAGRRARRGASDRVQGQRQQGVRGQLRDHRHQQLLADQPRLRASAPRACPVSLRWWASGPATAARSVRTSTSRAFPRTRARRSGSTGRTAARRPRRSSDQTARS